MPIELRCRDVPIRDRVFWLGAASAAFAATAFAILAVRDGLRGPLNFDDSYMFYRYALNIRHGLGVSWNPDGVPTYGLTSQLWVWFILPFTFLPVSAGNALRLASWLTGFAALLAMCFTIVRNAQSPLLRCPPIAYAAVALPLLMSRISGVAVFTYHMTTGIDTMLSLLANAALAFAALEYRAGPDSKHAWFLGLVAFASVLARPDNVVCAFATPLLLWAALPGSRRWTDLVPLLALPLLLILIELQVSRSYFGTCLPLSFYAKATHAYEGFQNHQNALEFFFIGSFAALPFLATVCATVTRQQVALLVAFLLPVTATFLYLLTVRQIMGFNGRYYLPFLPFLIVSALMSADSALTFDAHAAMTRILAAILGAFVVWVGARPVWLGVSDEYLRLIMPRPTPSPSLSTLSGKSLPQTDLFETIRYLGDDMLSRLPPGASMAASEVGYLGAASPRSTIVDLVGLNDTYIAIHGFSMDYMLRLAPDVIWFPHSDYTGLRAEMLKDQRLFDRYIVIAEAFTYGLAIRRDSPYRTQIEAGVRAVWDKVYPRGLKMGDYIAVQEPGR